MRDDPLLMIPGPTNLPDEVREALARPSVYHRGDEAAAMLERCSQGLKALLGTSGDALVLTSSGTGAMEAAVTNFLSPGDRVLAVQAGKFGERLGDIAAAFGADVTRCEFEYGNAADPNVVAEALAGEGYKGLLCVYNETSTGVTHPLAEIAGVGRAAGCVVIADCVSCLGGVPVLMDEWGVDVVAAGSQKCLMLPPGLAIVGVGAGAWERAAQPGMPRYYFDLHAARASAAKGQTPFTPNTSLLAGLAAALDLIETEGSARVFGRHLAMATAVRAAVAEGDLALFSDPAFASNTVTAVHAPDGVDSSELVRRVWEGHRVLISGGQGELKGHIFRIGHMGMVQLADVLKTLDAVGTELVGMGHACDVKAMLTAAEKAGRV